MTSVDEMLKRARSVIEGGKREAGVRILLKAADSLAIKGDCKQAAKVYEEAANHFKELYRADESFSALENATLMLVRMDASPEVHQEIVRINASAARIAEEATEYKRASDFYFRASDFAATEEDKEALILRAADNLEQLADAEEEEEHFESAIGLLRKVGRLYYSSGDNELGERITDRAQKVALRWAEKAREEQDYLSAGTALAEAAQILQMKSDSPEAPRIMLQAGELYETAGLYDKAGNIYDAAQESFKNLRQTSARKKAMLKAAEAYLKLEGKPEVVAPLLMKAGELYKELNSGVKAKWAFKKAGELFEKLAASAGSQKDIESKNKYLRFQAMSLNEWGQPDQASAVYQEVVDYHLKQAEKEGAEGNKELQAVSLSEVAIVLRESGKLDEAKKHLEAALELYVQLAEELASAEQPDESSKFYSQAAECASKLSDDSRAIAYHSVASEKALEAADFYSELGVAELSTIWKRAAGIEALKTNDAEKREKAIEHLKESAAGFLEINEKKEAFDDLFVVFENLFMFYPDSREEIQRTLSGLEEISMTTRDATISSLMSILNSIERGSHNAATLLLQENEDELVQKLERIKILIAQSRKVRIEDMEKRTGRTHWLYK